MEQAALALDDARTYGTLRLGRDANGVEAWIITAMEPHVAIRFKQVFPRIPRTGTLPYTLRRDTAVDADLHWFLQRYPMVIGPEAARSLDGGRRQFLAAQAEMERILLPTHVAPAFAGLQPGCEVRSYQAQAVELAARCGGLLLGDECGLGKTFVAAAFCLEKERLPAAVVCQLHIQTQWGRVIESFTTLRVHEIRKASPYDLPPADVYVFRYSQIAGWTDVFETGVFRTVVYDEPQELRTGQTSQKGQAAKVLTNHAAWRLGLTATPIYNYGQEIFNVLQFIRPGVLGAWDDFQREYCADDKKLKDPKALGTFLREQYAFLRRTKADVGKELPAVNRVVDVVDYDEKEVRSIEDLAHQLAIKATTGSFVERGNAARDLDIMVRQATGVAKAKAVADTVRILVEGGEPVVLFGWHRAVYDIWLQRLSDLRPAMYTGSESGTHKVRSKEDFLAGRTNLLIMSLRSAAGLDGLQQRCSTVVFGELDWSPGVHHQCVERVDREGQGKPVLALFLVAEDGSDPPMMEILGLKASEAHQVVDPLNGVATVQSDHSRLRALIDRYLQKAPVWRRKFFVITKT